MIAQLRLIEDIQQASPQFGEHVQKLVNIKHKVTVIYSVLQGAQVSVNAILRAICSHHVFDGRVIVCRRENTFSQMPLSSG